MEKRKDCKGRPYYLPPGATHETVKREVNQPLIDWAAGAVDFYDRQAEGQRVLTDEGAFPLLLASLMHLADSRGWRWQDMYRSARATYSEERGYARFYRTEGRRPEARAMKAGGTSALEPALPAAELRIAR